MRKPEVLAPAGDMESLIAAVNCGANAVYLGATDFSARQNAQNFDDEQLQHAVKYCHARDVKVYLTLNTLVRQDEMKSALELAKKVCNMGIDAIILQDMGLAQRIRYAAPALTLHASTQLSCHTPAGVKQLVEAGFKRVVLAREMSAEQIKQCVGLGAQIEVFVHGALCVSVSGTCLMSAVLGGRSGNRGMCAQPCRLPFTTRDGVPRSDENAISLKDLCLLDYVNELSEMGVDSLKIEGRMKRPEYVAAASTCYSKTVNGIIPSKEIRGGLEDIYSRSGFTQGYFTNDMQNMTGYRTKQDVMASISVVEKLANLYHRPAQLVPVTFDFKLEISKPAVLTVTDNKNNIITVRGDSGEIATNRALSEKRVNTQLKKTGGTPFYTQEITINLENQSTLSISSINAMRRQALEKLLEKRQVSTQIKFDEDNLPKVAKGKSLLQNLKRTQQEFKIVVRATSAHQIKGIKAQLYVLPLNLPTQQLQEIAQIKSVGNIAVEIPTAMFGAEQDIIKKLKQVKQLGIATALCNNIGALHIANQLGFKILTGWGLHTFNFDSLNYWTSSNASAQIISPELEFNQMGFAFESKVPTGIFAYGHLPLMILKNCALRKNGKCLDCKGSGKITDRKNISFPLSCDGWKIASTLCNSVPTYLADIINEIPNLDFLFFYFTDQSPEQVQSVLDEYTQKTKSICPEFFTRGMYRRGSK